MQEPIQSDGLRLDGYLARPSPSSTAPGRPGLVVCHGFPIGARGAATSGQTYPELADRLAAEAGWTVFTFNFRGTGASQGDFSLGGWLADLRAAVDHLVEVGDVGGVWLAGSSTGGSLAICEAGADERVQGVAALSARADFDDWAAHPRRFLEHARSIGVIRQADFPPRMDEWTRELRELRPLAIVGRLAPRPLLLVQGSDDEMVPVLDARALADCHGSAELRVINGAGHRLRHDPRAIAVLIGWLERQSGALPGG
ncbi:MAG TPA: alpha/beta fold hydrolase [Acidimicrobiales bacterium]|nr:alpha/beta fold hydrolase [Acidimicrobiales bacterium]